jgi:hypothetical protein
MKAKPVRERMLGWLFMRKTMIEQRARRNVAIGADASHPLWRITPK